MHFGLGLEEDNGGNWANAHAATMSIKHFGLQMCVIRDRENLPFRLPPIFPIDWTGAVVDIFPSTATIQWPPRLALNDTNFELFAARWQQLRQ
jgi:hypothetical protein